jgi:hypothetical protein
VLYIRQVVTCHFYCKVIDSGYVGGIAYMYVSYEVLIFDTCMCVSIHVSFDIIYRNLCITIDHLNSGIRKLRIRLHNIIGCIRKR